MESVSRLEQCRNEGPGERVEAEMSDASDSDDVSKRFGLKNSGSRVDTSDSDGVCGGGVDNCDGNLLGVEVAIERKNSGSRVDTSDSDEVCRGGVDNCGGEMSEASDSDEVSKTLGFVFCLDYPLNIYGFKTSTLNFKIQINLPFVWRRS